MKIIVNDNHNKNNYHIQDSKNKFIMMYSMSTPQFLFVQLYAMQ